MAESVNIAQFDLGDDLPLQAVRKLNYNFRQVGRSGGGGVAVISSSGSGDKTYMHTQPTAAATWTITHNMGKYPSVTVEDSAHNDVIGDITYNSLDQITLTFSGAFAGWAYLN